MDAYEREYVAAVINYFWGAGFTTPHGVNMAAAKVAYKALEQAHICSDNMDLVPRPMGIPSSSYILKQLVKIGKRIISGDTAIYHLCKVHVAGNYKQEMLMALQGV